MKRYLVSTLILIVLIAADITLGDEDPSNEDDLSCPDGEIVNSCANDCSEYCPKTQEEAQQQKQCMQRIPIDNCMTKCTCGFNKRRMSPENPTCVNVGDCPPFDCSALPNQEYNPCPPVCPGEGCESATPDASCPALFSRIGTVVECSPECHCIQYYWRKNGACVPYSEC